jgi:hypothetical protein
MDYFDILLAKKLNGGGGGDIDLQTLNVTENGTVNAPSGVAYNKVITNVPAPSNALFKQTLSGLPAPIATFTGADAPLDSLKASIEGVQDLHGYDKPWVGGAGKNIFCTDVTAIDKTTEYRPNSSQRANFTKISDNSFRATGNNGSWTAGYYEIDGINGTLDYAISYTIKDNNTSYTPTFIKDAHSDESKLVLLITFNNNSKLTTSEGVTFDNVQVELGETATAFAPYSNICPITGWTGCEVTVNNDTYTIPFKDSNNNPITVYGGGIDVTGGKLTVTHANIASYNGEAINEPWISSEDVYTQGATPTPGAQVVYPLTTPLVYDFNPLALRSDGVTNISVDCGEVTELEYFSETP